MLDRYDRTLVLKLYSTIWVPHLADLVPAIAEVFRPDTLVLRLARNIDHDGLFGLEEGDALIGVSPADPVLFQENGLTFEADAEVDAGWRSVRFDFGPDADPITRTQPTKWWPWISASPPWPLPAATCSTTRTCRPWPPARSGR